MAFTGMIFAYLWQISIFLSDAAIRYHLYLTIWTCLSELFSVLCKFQYADSRIAGLSKQYGRSGVQRIDHCPVYTNGRNIQAIQRKINGHHWKGPGNGGGFARLFCLRFPLSFTHYRCRFSFPSLNSWLFYRL